MDLLPTITSDITKNRTIDLLKYLRHKVENDFNVSLNDIECCSCGEMLELVDTPTKYISEDLKEIDSVITTLIERQEKIDAL